MATTIGNLTLEDLQRLIDEAVDRRVKQLLSGDHDEIDADTKWALSFALSKQAMQRLADEVYQEYLYSL
jgi:hypothetical protein